MTNEQTSQEELQVSTSRDTSSSSDSPEAIAPIRRSTTIHVSSGIRDPRRHSKKLSLSFPVLTPYSHDSPRTNTSSPSWHSPSPSYPSPYRFPVPNMGHPLTPPSELESDENPDFLTLIAGQERRVLELREELQKAESDLVIFKKKWAVFEANKKRNEIRNKSVKLSAVSPDLNRTQENDEEKQRRKELKEKKMKELAMAENEQSRNAAHGGRRNGQRVFGGRHTRTLSLLQSTNAATAATETTQHARRQKSNTESRVDDSAQDIAGPEADILEFDDASATAPKRISLSRQNTLQNLITSPVATVDQLNFGKTYKDLAAASRKSLPPGADVFVKQGKQVYEGVSQGFWNFVEDIRQATVGDEAAAEEETAHSKQVRKSKSNARMNGSGPQRKPSNATKPRGKDKHKPEKDTFWQEFGLDTPKHAKTAPDESTTERARERKSSMKEHESKDSTDSKYPPSLLADLMDGNEDDEAWDNWPAESPVARRASRGAGSLFKTRNSLDTDSELEQRESSPNIPAKVGLGVRETNWAELTS